MIEKKKEQYPGSRGKSFPFAYGMARLCLSTNGERALSGIF